MSFSELVALQSIVSLFLSPCVPLIRMTSRSYIIILTTRTCVCAKIVFFDLSCEIFCYVLIVVSW